MVDREAHSKVELYLSLRNLPQVDVMSKSDPMVAVFLKDVRSGSYNMIARTEIIWNNHDPDFKKRIELDYLFEAIQLLQFKVFDADSESKKIEDHNFMGDAHVNLADIVSAPFGSLELFLKNSKGEILRGSDGKESRLLVRLEEIHESREIAHFSITADKVELPLMAKGNPHLEIMRVREDGSWVSVYTSKPFAAKTIPKFSVSVQTLCNGDKSRPLKFIVHVPAGMFSGARKVGETETTLKTLLTGSGKSSLSLGKASLSVDVNTTVETSFLDYIRAGCQISLMVAIDFTASNGDPADAASLHHRKVGGEMNQYETAIRTVGDILASYDSDQKYPVWGFGAKMRDTKEISHCFPLTFDEGNPEVSGIDGILSAYRSTFPKVLLSGPTLFAEFLSMASILASEHFTEDKQNYFILLILTDGVINDMPKTIQTIVDASELPLSIIIIGIGDADFDAMNVLDADDVPLKYDKKVMKRDIVQFVPFREFKTAHPSILAKAVLEEIPEQFMSYVRSRKVKPLEKGRSPRAKGSGMPEEEKWRFDDVVKPGAVPEDVLEDDLYPSAPSAPSAPSVPEIDSPKKSDKRAALMKQPTVRECVVCLDAMADHIITPCMHLCLCASCAPEIEATKKCPACRAHIDSIKKVF